MLLTKEDIPKLKKRMKKKKIVFSIKVAIKIKRIIIIAHKFKSGKNA